MLGTTHPTYQYLLLPVEGPLACGSAHPGHTVLEGSQGIAWEAVNNLVWAAVLRILL